MTSPHHGQEIEPVVPNFDRFYEQERQLPQHDLNTPYPEGKNGRYLYVSNQHKELGWNNIFQNLIMLSHLAYKTNRSFVFEPYTCHTGEEPIIDHWGQKMASRIPLSAIIDGPIVGRSFPVEDPAPRAVTREHFLKTFPMPEERKRISIKEVNDSIGGHIPVIKTYNKWIEILSSDDAVIELYGRGEHPFDYLHFGDESMLGTWHTLSTSPVLTHFRWSSLVLDAVKKNASLIHPALSTDPLPDTPIAGLMVVHVRRGDYAHHYKFLANCSSDYMGWCKTPGMSDTFNPPGPPGVETEEKNVLYEAHGFPNAKQIGKRVHEITKKRQDWDKSVQRLRNLYIMTNGDPESINEVKRCIEAAMGLDSFDSITSSLDLILDNEQRYVNIAIDQAVAERAEVFVGNGFSSASANVVLMRRIHGIDPASTHFW